MARQVSRSPKVTSVDLRATKGALDARWLGLGRMFADILGLLDNRQQLRVDSEYEAGAVWAGFVGVACERVTRNRGGPTWVVPLCAMPSDLLAWLGWQEVWQEMAGSKSFQFRSVGLTVYIGRQYEAIKPQLLRLEWPGISNWSGSDLAFQSPGAGHPHWQIDLLHSIKPSIEEAIFDPEPQEILEDFEAAMAVPSINDLVRSLSIERMHLASAAPWWLNATSEVGHHMNAPSDLKALSRWLECSVQYLRQELRRCVIRP